MKKTKLISMTAFVLEKSKEIDEIITDWEFVYKVSNYAWFLKQPLKLEMFVPCDKDGKVLEEPNINNFKSEPFCSTGNCKAYKEEFKKAKAKVLFDGFEYRKGKANHLIELYINNNFLFTYNSSTEYFLIIGSEIEDLLQYNLTLTENAIKKLGL